MAKKKKKAKKKKVGKPTSYRKKFCQKLVDFFDVEPWEEREIEHFDSKTGNLKWVDIKRFPARMPTMRKFAKSIGIHFSTVYDWANPEKSTYHKEFADAFTCAKQIRKEWLIDLGLSGLTPPLSYKFTAINVTDMKDSQEHNVTGAIGTRELTKDEMAELIKDKVIPCEDAIAS